MNKVFYRRHDAIYYHPDEIIDVYKLTRRKISSLTFREAAIAFSEASRGARFVVGKPNRLEVYINRLFPELPRFELAAKRACAEACAKGNLNILNLLDDLGDFEKTKKILRRIDEASLLASALSYMRLLMRLLNNTNKNNEVEDTLWKLMMLVGFDVQFDLCTALPRRCDKLRPNL